MTPRTTHTANAIRDCMPKKAGEPGMSSKPIKIKLTNAPNPAITFLKGDTTWMDGLKLFCLSTLNNLNAVKHV